MAWESLTPDEWIKLVGGILGPFLAAAMTGGALLFQSNRNEKRDREKSEREVAELRRKEELAEESRKNELAEVRRKEIQQARQDWAAVYQEVLTRCIAAINGSELIAGGGHVQMRDRVSEIVEQYHAAVINAQVATARLFVVEQNQLVRATASAMMLAVNLRLDTDTEIRSAPLKIESLTEAFLAYLDELAGIGSRDNQKDVLKALVDASGLPQEERDSVKTGLGFERPKAST